MPMDPRRADGGDARTGRSSVAYSLLRRFCAFQRFYKRKLDRRRPLGMAIAASFTACWRRCSVAGDRLRSRQPFARKPRISIRVVANWSTPPIRLVMILPRRPAPRRGCECNALITTVYPGRADAYLTGNLRGLLLGLLSWPVSWPASAAYGLFLGTTAASVISAMGEHTRSANPFTTPALISPARSLSGKVHPPPRLRDGSSWGAKSRL